MKVNSFKLLNMVVEVEDIKLVIMANLPPLYILKYQVVNLPVSVPTVYLFAKICLEDYFHAKY